MTEREANRTNVELDDRETKARTSVCNRAKREEYSACQPVVSSHSLCRLLQILAFFETLLDRF